MKEQTCAEARLGTCKAQSNAQAGRRTGSGRTRYKPEIDSFHLRRDAGGHGGQGAERAMHFAGDVAGARARAGARSWRARPDHDQHHGQCSPGRPRWHLVGVRGPGTPARGRGDHRTRCAHGQGALSSASANVRIDPHAPRLPRPCNDRFSQRLEYWSRKAKTLFFCVCVCAIKVHP